MKRWTVKLAATVAATACLAFSQTKVVSRQASAGVPEARVRSATLGYIFDPEVRSLRLISGQVGAALLGPPQSAGRELRTAVVSPRQDYALAIANEDHSVLLVTFEAEGLAARPLGMKADQLALSSGGKSALLWDDSSRNLRVVTGLPGTTRAQSEVDLSNVPGSLSSMAVADDGASVLVALKGEQGSELYRADRNGELSYLGSFGDVSAIQFLRDSQDAVIADRGLMRVYRVFGNELRIAATNADGLSSPGAVAIAADNRRVFVVDESSHQIVLIDLDSGRTSPVACECVPQMMSSIGIRSLFQLNNPAHGTFWVLDASAGEPRAAFIPEPAVDGGTEK